MSTWISKALSILAVSGALGGCVAPGGTVRTGSAPVLGGALTVALPRNYCIDPKAGHEGPDSAVIIAGRCSAGDPVAAAAITISLGGPGSSEALKSGARALSDWARSKAGRAAFSRNGNAGSVRICQTLVSDGAFLILLEDRHVGAYWRAAIGLKGRLVMISVTPPEGGTLSLEDGRRIVGQVVQTMRRANAAS